MHKLYNNDGKLRLVEGMTQEEALEREKTIYSENKLSIVSFTASNEDLLNGTLSDEDICVKIKKVYEFENTVEPEDYVKYEKEISDLMNRNPNRYKTKEDVILFKKRMENEKKKNFFESTEARRIRELTEEEAKREKEKLIKKGYLYNE